jgi:hypothetical protein
MVGNTLLCSRSPGFKSWREFRIILIEVLKFLFLWCRQPDLNWVMIMFVLRNCDTSPYGLQICTITVMQRMANNDYTNFYRSLPVCS